MPPTDDRYRPYPAPMPGEHPYPQPQPQPHIIRGKSASAAMGAAASTPPMGTKSGSPSRQIRRGGGESSAAATADAPSVTSAAAGRQTKKARHSRLAERGFGLGFGRGRRVGGGMVNGAASSSSSNSAPASSAMDRERYAAELLSVAEKCDRAAALYAGGKLKRSMYLLRTARTRHERALTRFDGPGLGKEGGGAAAAAVAGGRLAKGIRSSRVFRRAAAGPLGSLLGPTAAPSSSSNPPSSSYFFQRLDFDEGMQACGDLEPLPLLGGGSSSSSCGGSSAASSSSWDGRFETRAAILYNTGQCQRKLGSWADADRSYRDAWRVLCGGD